MTPEKLRQAMPLAPIAWLVELCHLPAKWEINTVDRQAAFIGQLAHESGQFQDMVEHLSYSAPRLCEVWPHRFPTLSSALPYARNPVGLANKVYAGRLGNGDEASGDGYRFRGRGPIQITGRANYEAAGAAIGVDLIADPGAVLAPRTGLESAAWFWNSKKLNDLADLRDYQTMTKRINGGLVGLAGRISWIQRVREVLT